VREAKEGEAKTIMATDIGTVLKESAADFRAAGFYELPHRTLPNEKILVLNSVSRHDFMPESLTAHVPDVQICA